MIKLTLKEIIRLAKKEERDQIVKRLVEEPLYRKAWDEFIDEKIEKLESI